MSAHLSTKVNHPTLVRECTEVLPLSSPRLIAIIQAVFEKGASVRFHAKGFSMWPFIKDGDIVTISPIQGTTPRIGDIIVFTRPESKVLVVHRIVGKRGTMVLAKGDCNTDPDGWIPLANLLGRVVQIKRRGKLHLLSLGPERYLIALLTRVGLLQPLLWPLRELLRLLRKIRP